MMKNKTSLKKRILALVVVCFIVALSVIPCFADNAYGSYTAEYIPINFSMLYGAYTSDNGFDWYFQYIPYGGVLAANGMSYDIIDDVYSVNNIISVEYNSSNNTYTAIGEAIIFDFEPAMYLDVDYYLNAGNFFINPAEDEFFIDLYFDVDVDRFDCDMEISLVYSVLDDVSGGEIKSYADNFSLQNSYYFNLSEILEGLAVGDSDVFVYALNIRFSAYEFDDIVYTIRFKQNYTLIERNVNVFYMDSHGNITDVDYNSMLPFEEFFKALGIKDYKSSFANYTADYTSWIGNAVGGFLNMELMPFFSVGGILLICVALGLVGYFLKVFMGG